MPAHQFRIPELNEHELSEAADYVLEHYAGAPRLAGWLTDTLLDEATLMLEHRHAEHEWPLFSLPRLSPRELAEALVFTQEATYDVSSYRIGHLFDALNGAVTRAVVNHLNQVEEARCYVA